MLILSGESLREYEKENIRLDPNWRERNFTSIVRDYFDSKTEKVLAISGLRGTGKTVGSLQAARERDALYILAQKGDSATGEDYINILRSTPKKNVIIDEYSWINDRKRLDDYLLTAVQNGKRIALTATESMTLDFLNYGPLNHRVHVVHTTMFPYDEYLRLYGKKHSKNACVDYLQTGGLFKDYALKNYDDARAYIENAIVGNLAGYLKGEMSEEKARTLTYAVLYKAVCPSNLSRIPTLRDSKVTLNNFLDRMGINPYMIPDQWDLHRVADIFEQIGVIVKIPNYNKESAIREQYYIVNPSLTCQLIKQAYGLESLDNSILGHVFESCVGVQLATNRLSEHDIFFYNSAGIKEHAENNELDFVLIDKEREFAFFIECKFSQNPSLNTGITLLSGNLEAGDFSGVEIDGRYVVYNGEPVVQQWNIPGLEEPAKIVFTPISSMLDNYFAFKENIRVITDEHLTPGNGSLN